MLAPREVSDRKNRDLRKVQGCPLVQGDTVLLEVRLNRLASKAGKHVCCPQGEPGVIEIDKIDLAGGPPLDLGEPSSRRSRPAQLDLRLGITWPQRKTVAEVALCFGGGGEEGGKQKNRQSVRPRA